MSKTSAIEKAVEVLVFSKVFNWLAWPTSNNFVGIQTKAKGKEITCEGSYV